MTPIKPLLKYYTQALIVGIGVVYIGRWKDVHAATLLETLLEFTACGDVVKDGCTHIDLRVEECTR